jgi:hypothetical protein
MMRFHVHVSVDNMDANIRFYSAVFGAAPSVIKPDYAKWMLEDPRINFAISNRGAKPGVDHLGVQVDSDEELTALRNQAAAAEIARIDQQNATCCYSRSDKYWLTDPQGVAWETFHTLESVPIFGKTSSPKSVPCCEPVTVLDSNSVQSCCRPASGESAQSSNCCG